MPSAIRSKSYGSVTVYSVDKDLVRDAVERFVAEMQRREEVLAVVLFGSFAEGGFGVGSDIDLLLVLRDSDRPFLDRIPQYFPADFPVDVDVFPYTMAEVRAGQPLARTALARGRVLWRRPGFEGLL